ncbi:hsp90-like protein [Seiridium cupressi]
MAVKAPSEAARERETFKYAAAQLVDTVYQTPTNLADPAKLRSSRDTILTGLAELVALRLNAARAIISLFDQQWQYVIAEATPHLTLSPGAAPQESEALLLCGTAVPRSSAICTHIVSRKFEDTRVQGDEAFPLSVIPDLSPRLSGNPYFKSWPHRSYAGVPIRTPKGIDIGVLSIYGDETREVLDATSVALMQDVSRTIMDYLESVRSRESHRRADRMVRGVGTFVEGEASLSGWQRSTNTASFRDSDATPEGALNTRQQDLIQQRPASDIGQLSSPTSVQYTKSTEFPFEKSVGPGFSDVETDPEIKAAKHTFSKAANLLRESIEVEGTLFLDASISSFGGGVSRGSGHRSSSSSSSSEDSQTLVSPKGTDTPCRILGFSNSSTSSIDGNPVSQGHSAIPEKLLSKLIKRYPKGRIFNFDENGGLSSSGSSSEETSLTTLSPDQAKDIAEGMARSRLARKDRSFLKNNGARLMVELFPGARSVAFVPVWDSHRLRWFAGGFIYTKTSSRVFTPEGELSYFSAFASIVMAEIYRAQEALVNKSKTDLLGSLSHELRSPLHGVVLGAELLQDTELDLFQRDVLNSIENCCRTLMGTIDHLLDWTKINKFKQESLADRQSGRAGRRRGSLEHSNQSIETGMMSRTSDVDVGVIAEQVVESIFAGHSFQTMSVMRMVEDKKSGNPDVDSIRTLDSMQAAESMSSSTGRAGDIQIALGGVVVTLSIDANLPWTFVTQPGALRRILMNLVGNALKFTNQGFVEVRLGQESVPNARSSLRLVTIAVSDSGRGIGQEFLRHQLFKPFAQEDNMVVGAGLGLSLVKSIVSTLGGHINVESKVGVGSTLVVKLPLKPVMAPSPGAPVLSDGSEEEFRAYITELQGLRAAIKGYPTASNESSEGIADKALIREHSTLLYVCTNWLDLILCGDRFLDQLRHEHRGDTSTPTVVICRSALVARQMATSPRFNLKSGVGIVEFISQPLGPRKLAKVLLQCFRRWTKLQAASMSTRAASEYTHTEPAGLSPMKDLGDGFFGDVARRPSDQITESDTHGPPISVTTTEQESAEDTELPSESATDASSAQSEEGSDTPHNEEVQVTKKKARIAHYLLVDDNAINLRILSAYMKKLGHAYDTASDGLEALETFKKGEGAYKCVFMDISMPVMDGFEATREMRAHEQENKLSRCTIYALTGLASAGAQQEAFASGIDLFLTKPVKLTELSHILEERKQA